MPGHCAGHCACSARLTPRQWPAYAALVAGLRVTARACITGEGTRGNPCKGGVLRTVRIDHQEITVVESWVFVVDLLSRRTCCKRRTMSRSPVR